MSIWNCVQPLLGVADIYQYKYIDLPIPRAAPTAILLIMSLLPSDRGPWHPYRLCPCMLPSGRGFGQNSHQHIESETKWPPCYDIFKPTSLYVKCYNLIQSSSRWPNHKKCSIGLDNGLAQIRYMLLSVRMVAQCTGLYMLHPAWVNQTITPFYFLSPLKYVSHMVYCSSIRML